MEHKDRRLQEQGEAVTGRTENSCHSRPSEFYREIRNDEVQESTELVQSGNEEDIA